MLPGLEPARNPMRPMSATNVQTLQAFDGEALIFYEPLDRMPRNYDSLLIYK